MGCDPIDGIPPKVSDVLKPALLRADGILGTTDPTCSGGSVGEGVRDDDRMTIGPWGEAEEAQQLSRGPTRTALGAGFLTLVLLGVAWQAAGPGLSFDAWTSSDDGSDRSSVQTVPFADAVADRAAIMTGPSEAGERGVRTDLVDAELGRLRRFLLEADAPGAVDHLVGAALRMGAGPERALLLERATKLVGRSGNLAAESIDRLEDLIARLAAEADTDGP